jgi:transposase
MLKPPSLSDLDNVSDVRFYLCTQSTDMRKGFDALAELARQVHGQDIFSGSLFIFISRRRDRLKILYWDKDGLALWYKRLEGGTFRLPRYCDHGVSIKASELAMLLDGVDLRSLKRSKRLTSCAPASAAP